MKVSETYESSKAREKGGPLFFILMMNHLLLDTEEALSALVTKLYQDQECRSDQQGSKGKQQSRRGRSVVDAAIQERASEWIQSLLCIGTRVDRTSVEKLEAKSKGNNFY
jgi:hypothetical protein